MTTTTCLCGTSARSFIGLSVHARYCKLATREFLFWAKVEKGDGCWIWKGARSVSRYGTFPWSNGSNINASRAAWLFTYGPIEGKGIDVLHTCNNGKGDCVRPDHLYLGTDKENAADRVRDGIHPTKLKPEQVREIKLALRKPYKGLNKALAKKYGISDAQISTIKQGRQWKWVQP